MRKFFAAVLVAAGLVLILAVGCSSEYHSEVSAFALYYDGGFRNNGDGTVRVVNSTGYDMLLFAGSRIERDSIVGAVRAGDGTLLNCVPVLLRAVSEDEFIELRSESSSLGRPLGWTRIFRSGEEE